MTRALSRPIEYYRRHGFSATLSRLGLSLKRAISGDRLLLYALDLSRHQRTPGPFAHDSVQRIDAESALHPADLDRIVSVWNPVIRRRQISERFKAGASLWLAKSAGNLVAYGWTLCGHTIEPHFFPLLPSDAHLFDFFVFPEYRGRGFNPSLVRAILEALALEGKSRAFLEAAEWNAPQLASLRHTPLRPIGLARKFEFWGRTFVVWTRKGPERLQKTSI